MDSNQLAGKAADALRGALDDAGATMTVETPDGKSVTVGDGGEILDAETRDIIEPDAISGIAPLFGAMPGGKFYVPPEGDFEDVQFKDAVTIEKWANVMIGRYQELHFLKPVSILYLWKDKGGIVGGNATFGKIQKPSGLLLYYSGADFIIWFAADHCRDTSITNHQMEALIFHELSHIDLVEVKDKDGNPTGEEKFAIRGHDVTAFHQELERYGPWSPPLRQFRNIYEQLGMLQSGL